MGPDKPELISFDEPYAEEIEGIRQTIDASRARIARTLEDLQDEVEERLDWRAWVRQNPWKSVGVAAAVGFYFGVK